MKYSYINRLVVRRRFDSERLRGFNNRLTNKKDNGDFRVNIATENLFLLMLQEVKVSFLGVIYKNKIKFIEAFHKSICIID